ncbi:MAG: hypothetical protein LRZ97_01535, partial [Candidatus Pacebacteria bacterium]|nr:hypothetical protein [Candidatus Paceibacterota bacterium]
SVTKVAILDKELHIMSVEHPILKVKLDDYLERTAEYVEATLNSADYKSFVNNTEVVEYIDLRFGNRIYYK